MSALDPDARERLIAQFEACLDQDGAADAPAGEAVDLRDLLAEVAMLKNEIRLESRQFKGMLDEMRALGESLRGQNERLARELERAREQAAGAAREAGRGPLLDMLDLHDRLRAGVEAGAAHRPGLLARLAPGSARLAASLAEGQALTLQRLDETLARHRVRPLEVLGRPLDPHQMRAVGVEAVAGTADGIVLREARRGFFLDGELLRAAEVIVNKIT
ncbi:nucleotide exchange factor GrpE [Massilia glaciei]|uniref:Protein GrpE n=1 Tax=Massilia glaciei TaxID=1524097 RepID=A0A2U2HK24_9BURK|nr:nucleotide exchange factor GrpE [Massilia glaciei]PWF47850.1 nucleotide exchange factor GrpE [Massilia glaciei]